MRRIPARPLVSALAAIAVSSVAAAGQARVEKNVVVGMYSGLALVMDVHYPAHPNGYGVVHIAGSGWRRPLAYDAPLLSELQIATYGQPLLAQGYTVFSLNHRATPRFPFPGPLEDVQCAVRFIRYHADEYGIDPDRIGAVGGSSGGHLASMLGVLDGQGNPEDPDPVNRVSAKVQTVVARAAPTDLANIETSVVGSIVLLMRARPASDPQSEESLAYYEASPINHVSPDDPPVLLIHGDADDVVPHDQSLSFKDALVAAGVAARVLTVPGGGHGPSFPGAVDPPDYLAAVVEWFDRHLKR